MKCPECGLDHPEEMRFCGGCGRVLVNVCPKCGQEHPSGFRFCGRCGHSLMEEVSDEEQEQIAARLHRSMPKDLAEKIRASGTRIEGERRRVAVVFADIRGFTAMSERLDPEEVTDIVNRCFEVLVEVIYRYEGVVDKFVGDCVMALFGAPVAHENDAERAVRASLDMVKALEVLNKEWSYPLRMRVGINVGMVVAGNVGSDLRMDYTVMGDVVNVAERLGEEATSDQVLVSDRVVRLTRGVIEYDRLRPVRVRGREAPVEVYRVVGVKKVPEEVGRLGMGYSRLVGREKERRQLEDLVDGLPEGKGGVLCITGEAGIGKSRLKYEMKGMLSDRGICFYEAGCVSYELPAPYQVFGALFRKMCGIEEEDHEGAIRDKLRRTIENVEEDGEALLPYVGSLLSLPDEEILWLDDATRRERVLDAVWRVWVGEARRGPLVVILEDVQWVDALSRALLDRLVDRMGEHSILLCCIYRPELTPQWTEKPYCTEMALDQLPGMARLELLDALVEGADLPGSLVEVILDRSGGNPFYLEEVVKSLIEEGALEKTRRGFEVRKDVKELAIPDTIEGVILSRIDRLEGEAKETLQYASVIGRTFPKRLLGDIVKAKERLEGDLTRLEELELVYQYEIVPELEYIFKHFVTREVAYSTLLLKRRKQIHVQIGQAIERLYGDRLEECYELLAYHYSNGEHWEKAFEYYSKAGDKARELHTEEQSSRYYTKGEGALDKLFEVKRRGIRRGLLWGSLLCFFIAFYPFLFTYYLGMSMSINPFRYGVSPFSVYCVVGVLLLFSILPGLTRGLRFLIYSDRIGVRMPAMDLDLCFRDIVSITMEYLSLTKLKKAYSVAIASYGERRMRRHGEIVLEMRKGPTFYLALPAPEVFYKRVCTAKSKWDRNHGAVSKEENHRSWVWSFLLGARDRYLGRKSWGPLVEIRRGSSWQRVYWFLKSTMPWLLLILLIASPFVMGRQLDRFVRWEITLHQTARDYHEAAIQRELHEQDAKEIWGRAAELYTGALKSHPRSFVMAIREKDFYASMYYNLGIAYLSKGETARSIEAFERGIEMLSRHREGAMYALYNRLGYAYVQAGKYDQAIIAYKQAIGRGVTDVDREEAMLAYSGLGMAYYQQEQYDLSVEHYQKVIALAPSPILSYEGLLQAYRAKGWMDSVVVFEDRMRHVDPDGQWAAWLKAERVRQIKAYHPP